MAQPHLPKPRLCLTHQRGFTLIELLIAVLIIGILAAIALPAFNKQRARAKDSAAQQGLEAGLRALKAVYAEGESFPSANLDVILDRAERSQDFAMGNGYSSSRIEVERMDANHVILRRASASGAQLALSLREPNSLVRRAQADETAPTANTLTSYTNLLRNPSMENNLSSWAIYRAGGSVSTYGPSSFARSGNSSFRVVPGGDTNYVGAVTSNGNGIPVTPGQSYSGACYASSDVGTHQASVIFVWYDSGSTNLNQTTTGGYVPVVPRRWTRTGTHTQVAPAGAVILAAYCQVNGLGGATDVYYFDDFIVVEGTRVPHYLDGDSPGSSWTGAAYDSPSFGIPGANQW